ncbi:MAG: hypothetical protein V9E94_01425, partial [Microthrixaceae bacterium]
MEQPRPSPRPTARRSSDVALLVRTPTVDHDRRRACSPPSSGECSKGGKGVLAGVMGTIVVVAFFAGGHIIVGRVLRNNPAVALNAALLVYVVQIGLLFVLLALL